MKLLGSREGMLLGEILISLVLISSLVYVIFSIFGSMSGKSASQDRYSKAYYVASMKMEEVLASNYENIVPGCSSIADYLNDAGYLSGRVCVNVTGVNWDSVNDTDGKQVKVIVDF